MLLKGNSDSMSSLLEVKILVHFNKATSPANLTLRKYIMRYGLSVGIGCDAYKLTISTQRCRRTLRILYAPLAALTRTSKASRQLSKEMLRVWHTMHCCIAERPRSLPLLESFFIKAGAGQVEEEG